MNAALLDDPHDDAPILLAREADPWFGDYRLCFELSAGGMATVYLARKRGAAGFEKLVALKITHPHLARERRFVEMFLDEARVSSLIDHANVCSVFDFGEVGGRYFIAMEYLLGEPLHRVGHRLSTLGCEPDHAHAVRVARMIADAAEGLHAAHEARDIYGERLDVVHRDVSPHNLFATYDGVIKVVDFGIASARGRLHHTATGQVKGKFAYMAPEQLRGGVVDRRADLFSLGVVAHELLTLQRLFKRETDARTITAVQHERPAAPSARAGGLPSAIDAIVMRALAADPDERYSTARELARDLNRFIADSGMASGAAELSDWMTELFPSGRAHKAAVGEAALEMTRGRAARPRSSSANHPRIYSRWALAVAFAIAVGLGLSIGLSAKHEPDAVRGPERVAQAEPPPEAPTIAAAPVTVPASTDEPAPEVDTASSGRRAQTARTTRSDPRPPRHASAAEPRAGRVNVATTRGWADVYSGGRRVGEAPGVLTLPEGRHVLEVRPYGQAPYQRVPVSVRAGETARVRVIVGETNPR